MADLVKKHKKFLDDTTIKLMPIIFAVKKYFDGAITDFEESIKNAVVVYRKKEIYEEEEKDEFGNITTITSTKTFSKRKKKYEEKTFKPFTGKKLQTELKEILHDPDKYLIFI